MVLKKPTNKIYAGPGRPPVVDVMKVGTPDGNMFPGRLVNKGANDDDIAGAGEAVKTDGALGWLGYNEGHGVDIPATVDTEFVAGDYAPVISGPGSLIVAAYAGGLLGLTVMKGSLLTGWTSGKLTLARTTGIPTEAGDRQDVVVAIAMETVSGAAAADILVKSLI